MSTQSGLAPDFTLDARRRRRDQRMQATLLAAAGLTVVVTVLIVLSLFGQGWSFLTRVDLASLWEIGWFPRRGLFDLRTLVAGTVLVAAIAMAVAAPLGLGAAVYLSEYASPSVRGTVKPVLELLAGVPSVVLGFFAISFVTPEVLARLRSDVAFFNLAAAGIGVGILTLPLVTSIAEDALRAVPMSLREAAYGLGARKVQVAVRVVLPAAVSGIVAAFVIGLSRALGETMVVAIAAGATGGSLFSLQVFEPGQTMTAAMAALGAGTDQVKGNDAAFQSLFFVGLVLFVMTFALNLAGDRFVRRVRERYA